MIQKLKEEIRPARPPSLEQEVFVAAQRAADWLMRDFEELLKPHHLSPTQYNVLRILRSAGTSGMACHEIAERMITRDPDMTRLLDRLEEHNLISRSREKQDRRVIRVRITHEGLQLLKNLDDSVRVLHRRQLGYLGEKKLRLMAKLLQLVRDHED
jgi:DNA-binding MarR family transcriptional regulator